MIDAKDLADKFNATHKTRKLWLTTDYYVLEVNGVNVGALTYYQCLGFNNYYVWEVGNDKPLYEYQHVCYARTLKSLNKKVNALIKLRK